MAFQELVNLFYMSEHTVYCIFSVENFNLVSKSLSLQIPLNYSTIQVCLRVEFEREPIKMESLIL